MRRPSIHYALIALALFVTIPVIAGALAAAFGFAEPVSSGHETAAQERHELPVPTSAPTSTATTSAALVRDAGYYEPILNLDLDVGQRRDATVFDDAGRAVLKLASDAAGRRGLFDRAVTTVNFTILGAPKVAGGDRKIAHFTVAGPVLAKLSGSRATPRGALDAAAEAGSWSPSNDDVVGQFCVARSPICDKLR